MRKRTLTRAEISDRLCNTLQVTKQQSIDILEALLEQITIGLAQEGKVKISTFGTFQVRYKGARVGRNPKTGKEVVIEPRNSLSFRPSHILKSRVNRIKKKY